MISLIYLTLGQVVLQVDDSVFNNFAEISDSISNCNDACGFIGRVCNTYAQLNTAYATSTSDDTNIVRLIDNTAPSNPFACDTVSFFPAPPPSSPYNDFPIVSSSNECTVLGLEFSPTVSEGIPTILESEEACAKNRENGGIFCPCTETNKAPVYTVSSARPEFTRFAYISGVAEYTPFTQCNDVCESEGLLCFNREVAVVTTSDIELTLLPGIDISFVPECKNTQSSDTYSYSPSIQGGVTGNAFTCRGFPPAPPNTYSNEQCTSASSTRRWTFCPCVENAPPPPSPPPAPPLPPRTPLPSNLRYVNDNLFTVYINDFGVTCNTACDNANYNDCGIVRGSENPISTGTSVETLVSNIIGNPGVLCTSTASASSQAEENVSPYITSGVCTYNPDSFYSNTITGQSGEGFDCTSSSATQNKFCPCYNFVPPSPPYAPQPSFPPGTTNTYFTTNEIFPIATTGTGRNCVAACSDIGLSCNGVMTSSRPTVTNPTELGELLSSVIGLPGLTLNDCDLITLNNNRPPNVNMPGITSRACNYNQLPDEDIPCTTTAGDGLFFCPCLGTPAAPPPASPLPVIDSK